MKKLCIVLTVCLLAACVSNGPEKTLYTMASALENKDSKVFLAQFDMKRYAAAHVQNVTRENPALRTLSDMSKMLGMGGVGDALGSLLDVEGNLTSEFTRTVSTGELALACAQDTSPSCPWVARSLRAAKVKELSATAAIAQVTSPTNISSWLALRKEGENWRIVGHAPLEQQATRYALGTADTPTHQNVSPQGQQGQGQPRQQQPPTTGNGEQGKKPEKPTPM